MSTRKKIYDWCVEPVEPQPVHFLMALPIGVILGGIIVLAFLSGCVPQEGMSRENKAVTCGHAGGQYVQDRSGNWHCVQTIEIER